MTPEKKVQTAILKYLKSLQDDGKAIFFERRQAGGFSYKKGVPDLFAVVNGWHIEIEVKKVGGELSPLQEKFRDRCMDWGITWICTDSLDKLKEYIEYLLR